MSGVQLSLLEPFDPLAISRPTETSSSGLTAARQAGETCSTCSTSLSWWGGRPICLECVTGGRP